VIGNNKANPMDLVKEKQEGEGVMIKFILSHSDRL